MEIFIEIGGDEVRRLLVKIMQVLQEEKTPAARDAQSPKESVVYIRISQINAHAKNVFRQRHAFQRWHPQFSLLTHLRIYELREQSFLEKAITIFRYQNHE